MAIGIFNCLKGKKSALCFIKAHDLVFQSDLVYLDREAIVKRCKVDDEKDLVKGMEFVVPDGYRLVDLTGKNEETGKYEVRTTKESTDKDTGEVIPAVPLKTIAYG